MELVDKNYLELNSSFFCPSDPASKNQLTRENLDALSSYVLVTNWIADASSEIPLIIEKPHLHGRDGVNAFYVGGHAGFKKRESFSQFYKEDGISMPESIPNE